MAHIERVVTTHTALQLISNYSGVFAQLSRDLKSVFSVTLALNI